MVRLIAKYPLIILFVIFGIVQVLLYWKTGVFTDLEAVKYINEADFLLKNGELSSPKYLLYIPVILLITLCKIIGLPIGAVAVLQIALAAYALRCFYLLNKSLTGPKGAFFAGVLLCLFFPLQSWNFYLYSESTFISICIIYMWVLFKNADRHDAIAYFSILSLLTVVVFSRPHGLLLLPPTLLFLLLRRQTKRQRSVSFLVTFLSIPAMYLLLNMAFTGGADMDAMKPFIEEHIICFVPLKPEGANLVLQQTPNPVADLFYYIFHNPIHFIKLAVLKLWSFFKFTRPFYSTAHNIFLLAYIIPIYLSAVLGFIKLLKSKSNFFWFILPLLVLYPLGATFQCDDWHSRFTMPLIPAIILLANVGVYTIWKNKRLPPS